MTKKMKFVLFVLFNVLIFSFVYAETPFTKGVNLTHWFQEKSPRQIHFTKYTRKDFENIKSLGADVIRLPINLFYMTNGKPDYKIDPLFYSFLDQAVMWSEELDLNLIIDNHSTDDIASKNPDLENALCKVWSQVATRYKNNSKRIYYEILNEPNEGITTEKWGVMQQKVIDVIRAIDTKHTIIVGAANWNDIKELHLLPKYEDNNLLYTFHFYDMYSYTHQGAVWISPTLKDLRNVDFPYNKSAYPPLPPNLKGTWVEQNYEQYKKDGTAEYLRTLIDSFAVKFQKERNVKIYCGEFGVYNVYAPDGGRTEWYRVVSEHLNKRNIPWTIWDYQYEYGIFKKNTAELFDYDLNIPLVKALGFTPPAQKKFKIIPDSSEVVIYDDYIGKGLMDISYVNGGVIDYYYDENPAEGKNCILWIGTKKYGSIAFRFIPNRDFSYLVNKKYVLALRVKNLSPNTRIMIRFLDSKKSKSDRPWRMSYYIDTSVVPVDGKWHQLYIALDEFIDQGSYDDEVWYNPIGAFDWRNVDRFEIVTEEGDLDNKAFWFDDIKIMRWK